MFIYYTYNSLYKTVQTGTGRYNKAGKEMKKIVGRKKRLKTFCPLKRIYITQMTPEGKEVTNEFLHFSHITHFVMNIVRNKYKTFFDVQHHINIPMNTPHLPSASLHISEAKKKLLYYKREAREIS
jgi:hypothetical protein